MLVNERGGLQSCEYRGNKVLVKERGGLPSGEYRHRDSTYHLMDAFLAPMGAHRLKYSDGNFFSFWLSHDCCTVSAATVSDFSVNLDYNLVAS